MENYNKAIELLKAVLLESGVENDFDKDIYDFLKEVGELPKNYVPYWDEPDWVNPDDATMDGHIHPDKSIWSEIRDSFEDEGILHIDAWTTDDENDEDGHTIAKINLTTGEVEYLDERARTDASAQETIQWHVDNIKDENQKALDKMRDENWD